MTALVFLDTELTRRCPECGSVFQVNYRKSRKRFCGYSCSNTVTARTRTKDRNSRWAGGKTEHPLYDIYLSMIARCHQPKSKRYEDYGGRGIEVCQRWRDDFWAFVNDVGPRPEGAYPSGRAKYSLDRIDNDGNYEPGNTRWATQSQQTKNSRPRTASQRDDETGRWVSA